MQTHEGFIRLKEEKNRGENNFVPIDVKVINKKVTDFIAVTYPNVQYTRNIIWKSYATLLVLIVATIFIFS